MAGPGMRYAHVARVLGKKFDVTLAVLAAANKGADEVRLIDPQNFTADFDAADIIFAQWLSPEMIDYAKANGKFLVFDLYAPVPIEYLASLEFSTGPISAQKDDEWGAIIAMYNRYLSVGDAFTCSHERQRDFWVGYMVASGLIRPSSFSKQHLLDNFLICPMGTSVGPIPKEMLLRKALGLKKSDFVLVFTGGIYDWYDGQLMINAMAQIKDSDIKIVFLGNKHPNSMYVKETAETTATRKLAAKLGLTGKTVFFLDGWIPYDQRTAYFMDGDAAVYVDKESLETRFSHRTRTLDHFWMELPTICSGGDYLSEVIADKGLGIVIEERTPQQLATAIVKLKTTPVLYRRIKGNLHKHKAEFSWERTLQPLIDHLSSYQPSKPKAEHHVAATKPSKLGIKQRIRRSAKILLRGE